VDSDCASSSLLLVRLTLAVLISSMPSLFESTAPRWWSSDRAEARYADLVRGEHAGEVVAARQLDHCRRSPSRLVAGADWTLQPGH